ncbi:MAG: DUF5723 family protein [Haliscomenobacter sp.]|uniref:DUF5723 family protein n=1 Tax=Haliscomenobacter sp. TaxID=2717303 RepID=UPI0029A2434A|nr:DUF5723 family protein [Haliscomenobacter sp.]MDX2068052.1 DUF5723 family protein [Haliscomenobacter sp.]
MRKFTSHDYALQRMSRFCLLCLTVFAFGLSPLFAQRNLTLYNLPGLPQSQMMNVGRMPDYNFHLSLPLISNLNLGASSSGFSANDIKNINFDDQGENPNGSFFETNFSDFINQIGPYNTLGFDFNTTILDAGFRLGKGYIGIQGTETVQSSLGYSKSLFTTFDEIQGLTPEDFENGPRRYNVNGTFLNFNHHRTLGASYTHEIIPGRLSAGLRAKMAIGVGRAWTRNENFSIVGDYQQGILGLEGNVGLLLAGLPAAFDSTQGIGTYLKGTGNQGLALDLGAQFRVNDKIEVFASLVNLGQIVWKNNLTEYGYSTKYLDFYANQPEQAEEALEQVIDFVTTPEKTKYLGKIKSPLPMYVYAGGNYHFNKTFTAGAMVNLERLDGFNYWNFTLNGRANVGRVLQVGATLAQVQGIGFQVGAGAAINLGPLQIYAASDNVASVVNLGNARNAQLNVGINLVFGRGKTKTDVAMQDSTLSDDTLIASVDSSEQKKMKARPEKVKKEKTTVAKTKERPEPASKPVKTTPAPVSTPVLAATPTLRPWVNLRATTYNASSKELVTGVTIELYQKQADREILAFVRGNPGVDIMAPMERNREYRVVIKKNGFKPTEANISLDELAGVAELKKEFFLEIAPVEPPTVVSKPIEKPVEKPAMNADTTANNQPDATKVAPDAKNDVAAPQPNSNKLLVYMLVSSADLKPTASADGATVIKVGAGYRVQILEKTNSDWWLVSFRGYNGYLPAKVLREEK